MGNSNNSSYISDSEDSNSFGFQQKEMDEIVCEICVQNYDSEIVVPRVLECGHTLCTQCIEQLIKCSQICPKCRVSFTRRDRKDFPINYSLLEIADSLQQDKTNLLQFRVDKLIKKYAETEAHLSRNMSKTEGNLNCITIGLLRLRELNSQNVNFLTNYHSTIQMLKELNDQLDTIRNECIKLAYSKETVNIKLSDFSDSTEFLFEIYNRAAMGQKIYAVTIYDTDVKFARLSTWANQIVINSFGQPKENPTVKTVWYQDIKSSLGSENFRAFLEICCNDKGMRQILVIKTTNSSLVPQFLKFCSGEVGPVYKGASYFQGPDPNPPNYKPVLKIPKFIFQGDERLGNHEYVSSLGTTSRHSKNDLLLTGSSDGELNVVKLLYDDNIPDVIGKIEEPPELLNKIVHGNDRRITDSGIIAFV